jgi:hypothetical protein
MFGARISSLLVQVQNLSVALRIYFVVLAWIALEQKFVFLNCYQAAFSLIETQFLRARRE